MADRTARSYAASETAFLKARQLMPGGISSPLRACYSPGVNPIYMKEAEGCTLVDLDGNQYIDYVGGYGALIAGHANDQVEAALAKAIGRGTDFGAPTELESTLAGLIVSAMPAMELVRFTNSGTEAILSAIRLARAVTQRSKIVQCAGAHHGSADVLLAQLSLALTPDAAASAGQVVASSPGVPNGAIEDTLLVGYNDLAGAAELFRQYGGQIAAFIVEPIVTSMGVIPPAEGYLAGLRELCDKHSALLIFDEVVTGFRVGWMGAQGQYEVKPDLTCLGRIIGGGLSVGAFGGGKKLMELLCPSGKVQQTGALGGNPLTMVAGIATLEVAREEGSYERLEQHGDSLAEGIKKLAGEAKIPVVVNRAGSMLTVYFVAEGMGNIQNAADVSRCDAERYAAFYRAMLEHGVYLPSSAQGVWFISLSHDEQAIAATLKAVERSFTALVEK